MNRQFLRGKRRSRRGAALVLAALSIVVILALAAFAVDVGYIMLIRTQLQVAADSSVMAAAGSMGLPEEEMLAVTQQYAGYHRVAGKPVELDPSDVQYGDWDPERRSFTPSPWGGNAIRVTARTSDVSNGGSRLFFGKIFNKFSFTQQASAVAMANPRDVAFVVDLSGSMNNDTEPCWASDAIDETFAAEGYPTIGTQLMQQVYDDFGYGSFPGELEYLGRPWDVPEDISAYYHLTEDDGPLTGSTVPDPYRIEPGDGESTRKQKAYSAIIDYQIARVMPGAKPVPDSSANYAYWEKYLDYIIRPVWSVSRGFLPPYQDGDRINGFGNPNSRTFPQVDSAVPNGFRNRIGYRTYVQFMMDYGRDLEPEGSTHVPLSQHSADCPWHTEETAGGAFSFPPREQPTHAVRRALISVLQDIKQRNATLSEPCQRDWVSIITFDRLTGGGPVVAQSLTDDYDAAMLACTRLQAVGDRGASTATEAGMITAQSHIRPTSDGGQGRLSTNKVIVLLTDGVPNLYVSQEWEINQYIDYHPRDDFYDNGKYAYDAPLVQAARRQEEKWYVFPVGVGLGTDYDFMDRVARLGGTADVEGRSPRGSGNPAQYEQRLAEMLGNIITSPKVRLVR